MTRSGHILLYFVKYQYSHLSFVATSIVHYRGYVPAYQRGFQFISARYVRTVPTCRVNVNSRIPGIPGYGIPIYGRPDERKATK